MRSSIEIKRDLDAKMTAFNSAEGDARKAMAPEVEALTNELNDANVSEAAARAAANQRTLSNPEKAELKRFSISKFIREAANGNLTGFEAEMDQEGQREYNNCGVSAQGRVIPSALLRYDGQTATETGYGKEFVDVTRVSYIEGLRNEMVMNRLGATYMPGLQGNVKIVKGTAASASWASAEEASISQTKLAYATATMAPKRLQIVAGYTGELLRQSSLAVDAIIMGELEQAHAHALDAAAIAGSGTSGQPTGILSTSGIGSGDIDTNGGNITWAKAVNLETLVGTANGLFGRLAYLTNSKVMSNLKTIAKIAGYPAYLFEEGKLNGYDVVVSNAVPANLSKGTTSGTCSAMIFGNFNEVLIGQWGGLDVIVDPYSEKAKGIIEVSVAGYHDILVRRPGCFAAAKDITIA